LRHHFFKCLFIFDLRMNRIIRKDPFNGNIDKDPFIDVMTSDRLTRDVEILVESGFWFDSLRNFNTKGNKLGN
jgi:hypothetical protein